MKGGYGVILWWTTFAFVAGCGDHAVEVTGRVTCGGKPVVGNILFTPAGSGEASASMPVNAPLNKDGEFKLALKTTGKYRLLITPRDVKFPVPPGELDYPCDRSPIEKEVQAGVNDFTIEMEPRGK